MIKRLTKKVGEGELNQNPSKMTNNNRKVNRNGGITIYIDQGHKDV